MWRCHKAGSGWHHKRRSNRDLYLFFSGNCRAWKHEQLYIDKCMECAGFWDVFNAKRVCRACRWRNSGHVGWPEKVGCGWLLWPWCNYRHGIQPGGVSVQDHDMIMGYKGSPCFLEGQSEKEFKTFLVELWVSNLLPIFLYFLLTLSTGFFPTSSLLKLPGISTDLHGCRFEDVRPSCCIHRRGGTLCSDHLRNQQGFKPSSVSVVVYGSTMKQGVDGFCTYCMCVCPCLSEKRLWRWMLLENGLECASKSTSSIFKVT